MDKAFVQYVRKGFDMKYEYITVHKSSETIPYLACVCQDCTINDDSSLTIRLDNQPYRTDVQALPDVINISSDNWDWLKTYPLDDNTVEAIQNFRNQLNTLTSTNGKVY
jgi:hypothetical protein